MPIKIFQYCLVLSIFSWLTSYRLSAQSLSEYKVGKEEFFANGHWGFALSYSNMSNAVAPNPSSHRVSALAMKIDFKKYRFGSGKRRFYFQNKTIGDLLTLLGDRDKGRGENSALTTGFIGWGSWGWNLVSKQRTAIALGFNINDYIVGSTYVYTNAQGQKQSPVTNEPQGNYWGAGPTLFADVSLSEKLVLHIFTAYSISLLRGTSLEYAIKDNSYPKPHFLHLNAELQTRGHLYAGVDFTGLLNQGNNPNATQRIDLLVGYRF